MEKLYSENEILHWLLISNSNDNKQLLTISYCMFAYGWSALGYLYCFFYPMGSFVPKVKGGGVGGGGGGGGVA